MFKKFKFINLMPHILAISATLAIIIACGSGEVDIEDLEVRINNSSQDLIINKIPYFEYPSSSSIEESSSSTAEVSSSSGNGGSNIESSSSTTSSNSGGSLNSSSSIASSSSGESLYTLTCEVLVSPIEIRKNSASIPDGDSRPVVKCKTKATGDVVATIKGDNIGWTSKGQPFSWMVPKIGTYNDKDIQVEIISGATCLGEKADCKGSLTICYVGECANGSSSSSKASSSSAASSSSVASSSSAGGNSSSSAGGASSNSVTATCNVNNFKADKTYAVNEDVPRPTIVCSSGTAGTASFSVTNPTGTVPGWNNANGTAKFGNAGSPNPRTITLTSVTCGTAQVTLNPAATCGTFSVVAASSSSAGGNTQSSSSAGGGGTTDLVIPQNATDIAPGTYNVTGHGCSTWGNKLKCGNSSGKKCSVTINGTDYENNACNGYCELLGNIPNPPFTMVVNSESKLNCGN